MKTIYVVNVFDHPEKSRAFNTITAARCYLYEFYMENYQGWYGEADEDEGDSMYKVTLQDFKDLLERDCIEDCAEINVLDFVDDVV